MQLRFRNAKHRFRFTLILAVTAVCCFFLGGIVAGLQEPLTFENEDIQVTIRVNNVNLGTAITTANAVPIDINQPVNFEFSYQVLTSEDLILNRIELTVYFADVALYTHQEPLGDIPVPGNDQGTFSDSINLEQYLELLGFQLATGVYRVSANLIYHYASSTAEKAIGTDHPTIIPVFFWVQGNPVTSIIGVVAGAGAVVTGISLVTTVVSLFGVGSAVSQISQLSTLGSGSIFDWTELVKAGWRIRNIKNKARDVLALPNLAVLAATSILAAIAKAKTGETVVTANPHPKSRKNILDEIRERALLAWIGVRCPKCNAKWLEFETPCPKCNIPWETGRQMYAQKMVALADKAIPILAEKRDMQVSKLAKKLKTNDYYAGLVGTMLTDIGATDILKVKTPMRSLVINGISVSLVMLTWTQLLGYLAMGWLGWIAIISIGATTFFLFALLATRIVQGKRIRRLQQRQATKEKAASETSAKKLVSEVAEAPAVEEAAEEASKEEDEDTK